MRKPAIPAFFFFFFFAFSLLFSANAYSGEPSKDPVLQIQTTMHTVAVKRVATDAENKFLVTSSDDKTVRVWELATGRLLKVLRPPIGKGNDGKLFSVAISPDSKTIVCGGWTGYEWDGTHSIYIFDRESGNLVKRIPNLPNIVIELSYTKDGRYLAAALGLNNGIRVFSTYDYSQVAEDKAYGNNTYGLHFDKSNRLVTVSDDGYVRLYDSSFRLIAKKTTPGGTNPLGAAFSPDGSKVAIGFVDSPRVDVLSGYDLTYLYSPDTTGVDDSLNTVSWSIDGRSLYAGGMFQKYFDKWQHAIRKWSNEGKGPYKDLQAAESTIMHIIPLKNNSIVYGAYDPSFGVIDIFDKRTLFVSNSISDFRGLLSHLKVSYDAADVSFVYEWLGAEATFSLTDRILDTAPKDMSHFYVPVTTTPKVNITDWQDNYHPKLNGNPIKLQEYERSRAAAVTPDEEGFLIGAEWSLNYFDKYGTLKWQIETPSVTWGVNVSGDGRMAVAAYGDGTVRWYRLYDGKELLVFFPHKDRKRWVMWTPSGYYDASPGAEELIGWHLNNGKDVAADFFPASRFRNVYYRPDVIAQVLSTLDEKEAVRLADSESGRKRQETAIQKLLPPIVEIVSPYDGIEVSSTEVTLSFIVRTPSGEAVTNVKTLVDGRPVSLKRGVQIVPKGEDIMEVSVTVPEKDSEISIIAENKYSASEPATIRLKWKGKEKEKFIIKPKLYVVAVGVSNYQDKNLSLALASKDAKDFADTVQGQKGGIYRDVVVKLLTDDKATKDDILDALDWLSKEVTSKDIAMVFIAGHGVNDQVGQYYFLPSNADTEKLKRTGLPFSDITNTVASLAGKTILFLDTCHSGNIMGTRRGSTDITAVVNELASAENGAVVFTSSTGNQYSLEDQKWGNGAFTKALVEGISGKADFTGKGKISVNMLDLYISERVKELTKGKQTPTTTKPQTISDFPVALTK